MDEAASKLQALPDHIRWQADGWSIELKATAGVISQASITCADAAADHSLISLLAQSIVGMGLREARDHGVQYACMKQQAGGGKPAVSGIVMPTNYSPTSKAAARALRLAIDAAAPPDPTNWNFEDHGLSDQWRAIPVASRRGKLESLIKQYLQKLNLPDAAAVTDIDEYDRVFLQFKDDFPIERKPPILMELERTVRQQTGERIELFMSEMKDNNRIRRL